jgi:thiol:disulfide interchange protein
MHKLLRLFSLCLPFLWCVGEEIALTTFSKNSVEVVLVLERTAPTEATAVIVGTFTPKPKNDPLHLYAHDLKTQEVVPTRIDLSPGQAVTATGPLTANVAPFEKDGLFIYPDGPVVIRLPIALATTADGASAETKLLISYMACSANFCLNPVIKQPLLVQLPTIKGQAAPVAVDGQALQKAIREVLIAEREELVPQIKSAVADELQRIHDEQASAVRWHYPNSIAEIERLIVEAHKAGKSALLDFTGPSCVNCQLMDKTVFREPLVAAAWNKGVPISINTDPDPRMKDDLSAWQQQRFQTQNRPLYVRIDPDGKEERWSQVFPVSDKATMALFIGFASGGIGSDIGSGDDISSFLILAVLGGLFTLLMPCTYPMIPFTMTFFAKQAAAGRRLLPLAAFYSLGIMVCFVGLGVLITGVFGATLANLAGHPLTNLFIALLFIVLGLGLLGAFFIRLPSGLENALGGGRGGYLGALIMGLTFAVTAFSCTAPFAGAVLSQAVVTGSWTRAVIGMAVYSSAIALPFFALAMSPGLLKRMPKAGAWMNEFKVVGGLIELAAALKFLVICDVAWGWGIIGRQFTLASWAAVAFLIAYYVLGRFRFSGDEKIEEIGLGRLFIALTFIAGAIWLASGLMGNNLGLFESFFPGDAAP